MPKGEVMTTDTTDALLAAILAHPEDDGPRLVLADLLEERGDMRGEFIRVQCELAKYDRTMRCNAPEKCYYANGCEHGCGAKERDDVCEPLRRRERELWATLHRQFDIGVILGSPYLLFDDECTLRIRGDNQLVTCNVRRGFIERIELSITDFLAHAAAIFKVAPVTEVRLNCRRPVEIGGVFNWMHHDPIERESPWFLPKAIWDLVDLPLVDVVDNAKYATTEADALAASSAAAVRYGREAAGLPPLSGG